MKQKEEKKMKVNRTFSIDLANYNEFKEILEKQGLKQSIIINKLIARYISEVQHE
jgi:hypothetical protein